MAKIYPADGAGIASPVGKQVVDTLTRKTGNSLPTNHNMHPNLGGGSSEITGPAQQSIVKGSFNKPAKGLD